MPRRSSTTSAPPDRGRGRRRDPREPKDLKPLIMGNLELIDRVARRLDHGSARGSILEITDDLDEARAGQKNKILRDLYAALYREGKLHPERIGRDQGTWDSILQTLAQEIGPGVAKFLARQEDRHLPAPEPAAASEPATPDRDPRLDPRAWEAGLRIQFKGPGSSFASSASGYPHGSSIEVLGVDADKEEVYLAPGPDLQIAIGRITFKFSHLEGIVSLPTDEVLITQGEFSLEPGQSTVIKSGDQVVAEVSRGQGEDYALKIAGQREVKIIFGTAQLKQTLDLLMRGRPDATPIVSAPSEVSPGAPLIDVEDDDDDQPIPPPSSRRKGRLVF